MWNPLFAQCQEQKCRLWTVQSAEGDSEPQYQSPSPFWEYQGLFYFPTGHRTKNLYSSPKDKEVNWLLTPVSFRSPIEVLMWKTEPNYIPTGLHIVFMQVDIQYTFWRISNLQSNSDYCPAFQFKKGKSCSSCYCWCASPSLHTLVVTSCRHRYRYCLWSQLCLWAHLKLAVELFITGLSHNMFLLTECEVQTRKYLFWCSWCMDRTLLMSLFYRIDPHISFAEWLFPRPS